MWDRTDSNRQPLVHHERSTKLLSELPSRPPVPLAHHAPPGHRSYPHRLSGVSLAGPYEQISIVYVVWQILLSFSFLLVTGFSGPVTIVPARFTVPGHTTSSGGWICRKSVAFYYLAAIMSRNSAVFRREDSHSPSCPGMGGTALVLLRRPSSREAVKLTKLRNVLSG